MSVTIRKDKIIEENIVDDISKEDIKPEAVQTQPKDQLNVDEDKLAKLRAKLAEKMATKNKETEMASTRAVASKKEKSINFGFVGSGQAGSRISETAYKLGYDAVAINTAQQDLKFIDIPESNKLLLEHGLGGAAKDLEIGKQAAEKYREKITELINTQLADAQVFILSLSLGGGSGAGSCDTLVDILASTGKPVCVMTILPMDSEGAQTKSNALTTLSKLAKYAQSKKINNLIVVDNAKIEAVYNNVGQMDFFNVANRAIVEPLDMFNMLSAMDSPSKPLDSMEFAKLLIDGEGLCTYGTIRVNNYDQEDAIAEAVIENLNGNLLAGGFDLKQSKYVGVIVTANERVWKKITASSINYAMTLVEDQCGHPNETFKGIYVTDSEEDCVMIYSMFSGLSLPESRISQLKKEVEGLKLLSKDKDVKRNLNMEIDNGNQEISKVQEIKNKIAQKNSAFNKLTNNIVDRRK